MTFRTPSTTGMSDGLVKRTINHRTGMSDGL